MVSVNEVELQTELKTTVLKNSPGGRVDKNPPAGSGTRGTSLVREGSTRPRAAKPVRRHFWACSLERHTKLLTPHAANTEHWAPRICDLQQEKPLQWEAWAPQQGVAPAHPN